MNSTRTAYNLTAVSAKTAETALNTFQTLDMSLMVGDGDYLELERRRETNGDEMTGLEESDLIYDNGATGKGSFNFAKLQPHHAAFLLAYGLGSVVTTAAGTGYLHTIKPIVGDRAADRSNPTFTVAQRLGKTIAKRRLAGVAVNSVKLGFAADGWVTGVGELVSTGRAEDSVIEETVTALDNVTSLTLAASGVAGTTAAERLDNIQVVRAMVGGGYKFATVTAVSAATPAAITITSLGGAGASVGYKILYTPVEPAWCAFPAKVVETPMRVTNMQLHLGGSWNGTQFIGGRQVGAEFAALEYTLNNNLQVEWGLGAVGYANRIWREGRDQKLSLDRELRDMLLQNYLGNNENFGLRLLCEGAEYAAGHKYTLELIFPRLGLLAAPISSGKKRLAEKGDLQVLEDAVYGSVIAKVKNLVNAFAV